MSSSDSARNTLLLVEGNDDVHVVEHIREISSISQFSIHDAKGITKLLAQIDTQVKAPDRQVLGIIVDADDNLTTRWQSVSDRLARSGITLPPNPDPTGTIIPAQNDMPRIGIWLWPDNQNPGEIEDFIKSLIPEDDTILPLSEKYIDKVLAQCPKQFKPGKKSRAQVHAWLAVRDKPRPMGLAIKSRDLNAKAPTCATFVNWLKRLFEPA